MDTRNRIGLYGSYFLGMAGIGFTLPYLPLYLQQAGLSIQAIGWISTLAALLSLLQFPVGLWSDRLGWRKPFLISALGILALATALLPRTHGALGLGLLAVLFAENGICRAIVESLAGAEAAALAQAGKVGSALGTLRLWKPIGIVLMALFGGRLAERISVGSIVVPLAGVQLLAVVIALFIHEPEAETALQRFRRAKPPIGPGERPRHGLPRDRGLWAFVAAMVLFHVANAPAGICLGLFLNQDLHAPNALLAYAFVVSMVTWMVVVWPAGWLADRWGRRPLLVVAWTTMTIRLVLVAIAHSAEEVVAVQVLDGLANGLFTVVAAVWVTDRLADVRRVGEAQVIVGTALVFGSALGPVVAALLVAGLGYRGLFGVLAGVGALATATSVWLVPETVSRYPRPGRATDWASTLSEVSPLA